MKRLVLILTMMLLVPWMATAQVGIGLRAGATFSTITGMESDDDDLVNTKYPYATGFEVGLVGKFPISKVFSIQPELAWRQKGVVEKMTFTGDDFLFEDMTMTSRLKTNYLDLAILGRMQFGAEGKPNFVLTVGPYAGYWVSGKWKMCAFGEMEEDVEFEPDDGLNRFDVGIMAGPGVAIPVGKSILQIDVRYQRGFVGLVNYEEMDMDRGDDKLMQNSSISAAVTWFFHP